MTYQVGDIFAWQPDRAYDAICFGFWISHVPLERLPGFLATVAAALKPDGKVSFVDGRREPNRATDHRLPEADTQTMTVTLTAGTSSRSSRISSSPPSWGCAARESAWR